MAVLPAVAEPQRDAEIQPQLNDYSELSLEMENWSPQEILDWAIKEFGATLAFGTAFGVEGCVLMAMMAEIPGYRDAFLFNLETGYQFEETLRLRDVMQDKYGLAIHLVSARESVPEMEARSGGTLYDKDPDECCRIRKVVPLRDALQGFGIWIASIRRDQSPTRRSAPIVQWDKRFNLVKLSPLANWTRKDVWNYVFRNNVPYSPLYDQGYTSIGCYPCTRSVAPGEDERAGRWANFEKKECGLHVPNFQI